MVIRYRLLGWPSNDVEDPSLQSLESSGSEYIAFAALYLPAAVRFAVVTVESEAKPSWRGGMDKTVVDGVGMAGVATTDPPPGGSDGPLAVSTVSAVDSVTRTRQIN